MPRSGRKSLHFLRPECCKKELNAGLFAHRVVTVGNIGFLSLLRRAALLRGDREQSESSCKFHLSGLKRTSSNCTESWRKKLRNFCLGTSGARIRSGASLELKGLIHLRRHPKETPLPPRARKLQSRERRRGNTGGADRESVHSESLIWKSAIISRVIYAGCKCLSRARVCIPRVSNRISPSTQRRLPCARARAHGDDTTVQKARASNRRAYTRPMNNSGTWEFVRVLRMRPRTLRDRACGIHRGHESRAVFVRVSEASS